MDSDTWRRAIRRTLAYAGMIAAAIVFCMLLLRLIAGAVSPPAVTPQAIGSAEQSFKEEGGRRPPS
jgi:hypothetical protein